MSETGKGWRWRMDRAKILRERFKQMDKIRDPVVEEFIALSLNPAASPRRVRDIHDRLQALNKQYQVISTEWNLLWDARTKADPHVVATNLWNYFLSSLNLDPAQGPSP